MKRYQNMTMNKRITDAIIDAERMLHPNSPLMQKVERKMDFKYDSGLGPDIVHNLCMERDPVQVFTYKPWYVYSRAIGYFDGKAIHVNLNKLSRMSHEDIVANMVHEFAHYCGYRHGNNMNTLDKRLFSVPYFLSENVGGCL